MLKKILILSTILSGVLLALILSFTTPTSVGPLGILTFFVLVYIVFVGAFTGLVSATSFVASSITKGKILSRPIVQISTKKAYYYGSILASMPVLIIALQTFGGISLLEFGLILLFVAICCFLVSKR